MTNNLVLKLGNTKRLNNILTKYYDKWKDNNKKLRTALEYAITRLQEQVPIEDSISRPDEIYYIKVPDNLVAIDFDLRDKDCKSGSAIHLYFR